MSPCIGDDDGVDEVDVMVLVMGRSNSYLIRLFCAEFDVSSVNVTVTYSAHADGSRVVRFVLYGLVSDG